ncbi:hypothetical protein ACFXJQ_20585, partial [Streptomyces sp. NPDC059349]
MNDWHSWAAIAVFIGAYTLIISEKIHRVAGARGGAGGHVGEGGTAGTVGVYACRCRSRRSVSVLGNGR